MKVSSQIDLINSSSITLSLIYWKPNLLHGVVDQELAHVVLDNSAAITIINATIGRKEMTGMDKGEELYFKYRTGL